MYIVRSVQQDVQYGMSPAIGGRRRPRQRRPATRRGGGVGGMRMDGAGSTGKGLRHIALFYRDLDDYALAIADFLRAAAAAGEPTLIAVPGVRQERLRLAIEQGGQLTPARPAAPASSGRPAPAAATLAVARATVSAC